MDNQDTKKKPGQNFQETPKDKREDIVSQEGGKASHERQNNWEPERGSGQN